MEKYPKTPPTQEQYVAQRALGAYIASMSQPETSFDLSFAAQTTDPPKGLHYGAEQATALATQGFQRRSCDKVTFVPVHNRHHSQFAIIHRFLYNLPIDVVLQVAGVVPLPRSSLTRLPYQDSNCTKKAAVSHAFWRHSSKMLPYTWPTTTYYPTLLCIQKPGRCCKTATIQLYIGGVSKMSRAVLQNEARPCRHLWKMRMSRKRTWRR